MVGAGTYHGAIAQILRGWKYRRNEALGRQLADWLIERIGQAPWAADVEAVVPVPSHWTRRWHRSPLPAAYLADRLAGAMGLPVVPLLRRTRRGRHQIGLSYAARLRNVRGAFALRRGVSLKKTRLLLVDDVKTTGATLDECARVLRAGGAGEIYAAVAVTTRWSGPRREAIHEV